MTIRFEQPLFLWLLLLVVPVAVIGWYRLSGTDLIRRTAIVVLRSFVLAVLLLAMAGMSMVRNVDNVTVIGVADISDSVKTFAHLTTTDENAPKMDNLGYLRWWFRKATEDKRRPGDRFGLVAFDGSARAVTAPTTARDYHDDPFDVVVREGTNIEDAIEYAMAMFPPDTKRRIVLFTDGVETAGNAIAAAARNGAVNDAGALSKDNAGGAWKVPIDVVPIQYHVNKEIQVDRVEVPSTARPGQRVTVRIVISSTHDADALVDLTLEGQPVDLNGNAKGSSRLVHLKPGINVETADVTLSQAAVNRFEAYVVPVKPDEDTIKANNTAEAFTVTPDKGSVLVLDGVPGTAGRTLPNVLQDAGLAVRVVGPTELPVNPIELQSYDLIVLENVPAEDLSLDEQNRLVKYVQAFGGGLLMVGGYDSFGAGGWIDTPLDPIMPVQMRIPDDIQIPTAAIAIVLDRSGSMNDSAGHGESKMEVADEAAALAVHTLEPSDLVSVISFSQNPDTVVPLQKVGDGKAVAEKIRSISANGGTNMGPALEAALNALKDSKAQVKHIVCLSDGRSQRADFDTIVKHIRDSGITLSTIAVGNDADAPMMNYLAKKGGGEFYYILRPEVLPRIFVKDIRIVRRPLIREVDFTPVVLPTGSPITSGLAATMPQLHGFVLTQPRKDPTVDMLMKTPDNKPLLADWQSGLGKVGVFTSDAHDNWARDWIDWPGYRQMWTGFARALSRPVGSDEFDLATSIDGDQMTITLNEVEPDEQKSGSKTSDNSVALSIPGTVYGPNGQTQAIRLKPTGPYTYSTQVEAQDSGSYMVALTPRSPKTGQINLVLGGMTRRSGIEYRRLQSDTDMLKRIAEMTGGRPLDPEHPEKADLFDRADLPQIAAVEPISIPLLIIAIILFLMDVATRRIAWSGEAVLNWISSSLRIPSRSTTSVPASIGQSMQAGTASTAAATTMSDNAFRNAASTPKPAVTTVSSYRKAVTAVEERYHASPRNRRRMDQKIDAEAAGRPEASASASQTNDASDSEANFAQRMTNKKSLDRKASQNQQSATESDRSAETPVHPSPLEPMKRITRKDALALAEARKKAMDAIKGRSADATDSTRPTDEQSGTDKQGDNNTTSDGQSSAQEDQSNTLFKRLAAARKRATESEKDNGKGQ